MNIGKNIAIYRRSMSAFTLVGLASSLTIQTNDGPRAEAVKAAGGRVGRNQACPCGSGKKHKHCCLPILLGRRKVD